MIPVAKPFIGEEEKQAVMAVMESGRLAQGPRTAELEQWFADTCQVRHGIGTSSGTSALQTALMAHQVGPGDEVITTAFTFIATVNSILFTGAKPVFVDIDEQTFNIDSGLIEDAITPRTKAIMPVHLYGYPCDMDAILSIAEKHGLAVIEDAAQAVGATYKGKPAGGFSTGCFSLYATKNIMSGEGGMITTDDDEIADRCRLIRNHGMRQRYHYEMVGNNFRMSDLHAAIGLAQTSRFAEFTEKRQKNAAYLNEHITSVITPLVQEGYEHVWHQYTIRVDSGRNRDQAIKQLNEAGVGTGIFYPIPCHQHDHIRDIVGEISLPVTEKLAKEVISLPVHPQLSQQDLETIVEEVNRL